MEVRIRPIVIKDAYTSVKWRNDKDVFKYTGNTYDHEITLESELEWIKRIIAKKDDYRCAILVDGVYVGNIYLTDISNRQAEYHIFIGNKNYWGKGIAKKASELIIDYGFKVLSLKTIYLEVRNLNFKAIKLYESLGFNVTSKSEQFTNMAITNPDIS